MGSVWRICKWIYLGLKGLINSPFVERSVVPEKYSYPTTKRISLITPLSTPSLLDFPFLQGTDDPNTHHAGISTSVVKTP